MSLRDLLVVVDGDSLNPSPLAVATWLAGRFEAHLVGLHPSSTAKAGLYSASFGTEPFDDAMRWAPMAMPGCARPSWAASPGRCWSR